MAYSEKTMTFAVDLLPNEDNTYSLGSSSQRWKIFGDVTGNIHWDNVTNKPLILTAKSTGFTIKGGTTAKTLTVNADYTLAAACAKAVTDSSSASAISTGTSLPTERDIYYGLPTINEAHNYTSNTTLFAPISAGTLGYVLKS
jgi:hypothetical protein